MKSFIHIYFKWRYKKYKEYYYIDNRNLEFRNIDIDGSCGLWNFKYFKINWVRFLCVLVSIILIWTGLLKFQTIMINDFKCYLWLDIEVQYNTCTMHLWNIGLLKYHSLVIIKIQCMHTYVRNYISWTDTESDTVWIFV